MLRRDLTKQRQHVGSISGVELTLLSEMTENSKINLQSLITSLPMRMKKQVKGHLSVVISLMRSSQQKHQVNNLLQHFAGFCISC